MSKIEKAAHILAAMVRIQPRIAHFTDLTPEKMCSMASDELIDTIYSKWEVREYVRDLPPLRL